MDVVKTYSVENSVRAGGNFDQFGSQEIKR